MYKYLDKVNSPQDIKNMTVDELDLLAKDIRKFLVRSVSQTGGHLASNLGVVELTLALHKVFDSPKDKIVWDVGHQSYVHKIITGRKDNFKNLRQFNGMSGFPKECECEHDIFDTGHSSTSISVAQGLACARDIKKEESDVIAVIGDGSITGGMALEALNHVGYTNTDMIIILNDNEMSIDKNVGGMSRYLSGIIRNSTVNKVKDEVEKILQVSPGGNIISKTANKVKDSIISKFIPQECSFFESIGIKYYGPVDGHNTKEIIEALNKAKSKKGPVLLHVITKKGKGYRYAEEQPDKYHGVSKFDIKSGIKGSNAVSISNQVGQKLSEMANKNENIVAITAAMPDGTGLKKFGDKYPDKFFDVGIAEEHAVTFAAGLAANGKKPFISIYSSFYQRAYDQIIHDVCLQNLPVTFIVDRAGLVGKDGETHQGIFDISFFSNIPNMTIIAPKNGRELEKALEFAQKYNGPIAIRFSRGKASNVFENLNNELVMGKSETLIEGKHVAIIAVGNIIEETYNAVKSLNAKGYKPTLINALFFSIEMISINLVFSFILSTFF